MSKEVSIPEEALAIIDIIPRSFVSDGCTNSPDTFFGFDFTWACKIHDWRYCARCHDPVFMTYTNKLKADNELRQHISDSLPFKWKWISWVYYAAVWKYGVYGPWNNCGPEVGTKCRHGMGLPQWMKVK